MTRTSIPSTEGAGPLPFSGSRTQDHQPYRVARAYGGDQSGEVEYRFNSKGYRCEEYDPCAARRIVVAGCSYVLGVGLNVEETWPERLRRLEAERLGLEASQVDLQNFAQGGASNAYIARTVLTQLARVEADLVVVHFTHRERSELVEGNQVHNLGWWVLAQALEHPERVEESRRLQAAQLHYGLTSDEQELLDTLQSMLLVQNFCRARGIEFVGSWVEIEALDDPQVRAHPVVGPVAALLDRSEFIDAWLGETGLYLDLAADGRHPGAVSQQKFTERISAALERRRSAARAA
jgi:hypothetical protein